MKITDIPISKIKISKFNVRKIGVLDDIEELRDNIKEIGIKSPVSVHEYRKGKYKIISGQRRYIAAKKAGLKEIPCIIRTKVSDIDVIIESFSENIFRSEMTLGDKAKAAFQLLKKCNGDKKEVAKKLGVQPATVDKYLDVYSLPSLLKDYMKKKEMNYATAKTIYKKSKGDERHMKNLAKNYVKKGGQQKTDFYAAIAESNSTDSLDKIEKNYKKISKSKKMHLRLPTAESEYIKKVAKNTGIEAAIVTITLLTVGISMHKMGKVKI